MENKMTNIAAKWKRYLPLCLLLVATIAHGDIGLTGDGRVLSNPTSNGDFKLRVNVGGTPADALAITGSTGKVEVATSAHLGNGTDQNRIYGTTMVGYPTAVTMGASNNGYPVAGYNFRTNTSTNAWDYNGADFFSGIQFLAGGFKFLTAASGTAGNPITAATVIDVTNAGGVTLGPVSANNATGGQYHSVNGHLWAGGTVGTSAGDKQFIIGTNTDIAAAPRNGRVSGSTTTGSALLFQNTASDTATDTIVFYSSYAGDNATGHLAHGIASANAAGTWTMGIPNSTGGIKLPTVGGTPSTLDFYEESSGTLTFDTNTSSNTGVTYRITRLGKLVVLTLPQTSVPVSGTPASVSAGGTGGNGLPSRFCPGTNQVVVPIAVSQAGTVQTVLGNISIGVTITGGTCVVTLRKDALGSAITTNIAANYTGSGFAQVMYTTN